MASSTPHTIVLRSNNSDNMMQRTREAPCQSAVTITPGMLLAWGTTNTVKPHATENGDKEGCKVAIENPWSDHGDGPAIDHAYAAGETVFYINALPGDQLYMLLEAGANVAKGAALTSSNTAGLLQAAGGSAPDRIVGYAAEAVNNSGGGSPVRIRVDIA